MTKKELKGYRALKAQIATVEQRIANLELLHQPAADVVPLRKEYSEMLHELYKRERAINRFIQSIDDFEVQQYVRLKYLDGLPKSDYFISMRLNYHRTTLAKRLNHYLE